MLALALACAAAWTPADDVYAQATEEELMEADEVPDEASTPDTSVAPGDEDVVGIVRIGVHEIQRARRVRRVAGRRVREADDQTAAGELELRAIR